MGRINYPDHPRILAIQWWVSHVPEQMPQFIHVPSTATDAETDSDDDVTVGSNTMASGSRDRIGHPDVDVDVDQFS